MSGIIDKIKGKLMKIEGRLTGDKVRETQGSAMDAKGDLEVAGGRAVDAVKSGMDKVKGVARDAKARVSAKIDQLGDRANMAARRRANRKRARGY